jgi:hypothetical protein
MTCWLTTPDSSGQGIRRGASHQLSSNSFVILDAGRKVSAVAQTSQARELRSRIVLACADRAAITPVATPPDR